MRHKAGCLLDWQQGLQLLMGVTLVLFKVFSVHKVLLQNIFYAGWFSCTLGYVPVLLIFICEHNCVSIIKQPQRRKYEWLWKKEHDMWILPIWEVSVM